MSRLTERAVEAGRGGVRLSAEPLFTGEMAPLMGWRGGEDWVGDRGAVWFVRAPSGESGVLQRSFGGTKDNI